MYMYLQKDKYRIFFHKFNNLLNKNLAIDTVSYVHT